MRLILDLMELNKFLVLQHFMLESLDTAIWMVKRNAFMSTIDLQDAYFTVEVHPSYRKFLKFRWDSKLFQFKAVPMGLACAPYIFTKLLVPLFTHLREEGCQCFCYLDDVFITEDTRELCRASTMQVKSWFQRLGFKIQEEKSQFEPEKVVKFLGFLLDSIKMQVYLPSDKIGKMSRLCTKLLDKRSGTIQEVASVVGLMNSYAKAIDYGENHMKKTRN